ncbi:zinc knuckle [Ancylostoma ceylanicum]|uniref:Zinc knuckle n=1 Tax=Ancylostoma ceylanicum TaxID=53326 RepID=A0A0D6M7K7_9BILA|nr:zinc knuckle [Ancylostoma ceylanicum]
MGNREVSRAKPTNDGECMGNSKEARWQKFRNIGQAPSFQPHQTQCCSNCSTHVYCGRPLSASYEAKKDAESMLATGRLNCDIQRGNVDIPSGSNHDPVVEYMKLSALPEVSPFHGNEKESFNRFVNAFSVKYPSSIWDDRSRVQLFEGFLRKDALTMFETLPKAVKDGPFEVVVEAMKQRLKVDSNGSCVKAMTQLAALTIREGQSVAEFCLVLEKLAGRAYPDIPSEIVSLQKAEILFRQLASWEGSYCIAEAIETSSRDEVYEKVKEVALRLERNRKMASNMSQPPKHLTRMPHTKRKFLDKSPRKFELSRPRHQAVATEDAGTSKADTIRKEPSPTQSVGSSAEESAPIQCYKCGKRGHKARDCRETASSNTLNRSQGRQTGSFSAFLDSVLCTSSVSSAVDRARELFVQMSVVIVELMGMQVEALLDTGSETSIIPLALFKFAREYKVDLDKYVERIPTVDAVIRNASGEQMKFVDTIRMEVGLNGRKNLVAFHVGGGLDRMVILGTNALETFGIQLTDMTGQPSPLSHASVHRQEEDLETTTKIQAIVSARTYIPPGSVKMVKLLGAAGDQVFWSSHSSMSHGCCRASTDGTVEIPVINTSDEAMVLKEGQVVGELANDVYFPLRKASSYSDMMESTSASQSPSADRVETLMAVLKGRNEVTAALEGTLREFADVFAVSDKELTRTDLVVHHGA